MVEYDPNIREPFHRRTEQSEVGTEDGEDHGQSGFSG
jgi:hypothetical protein